MAGIFKGHSGFEGEYDRQECPFHRRRLLVIDDATCTLDRFAICVCVCVYVCVWGGTYTYINIHTHTNTNIVKHMCKCVTGILDRFAIYACVGQRGVKYIYEYSRTYKRVKLYVCVCV